MIEEIKKLQKDGLKLLDMHTHTIYSDGSHTPQEAVDFAKKNNFSLCITDHNKIKGSLAIKDFTLYSVELTSFEYLDLLVYFSKANDLEAFYNKHILKKQIKEHFFIFHRIDLKLEELVGYAKQFNALTVLAHPCANRPKNSYNFFKNNQKLKYILRKIDAVEGENSMISYSQNKMALKWADQLNKPVVAGSDGHSLLILGSALTACYAESKEDFIENIKKKKAMIYSKELSLIKRRFEGMKVLIKNLKF